MANVLRDLHQVDNYDHLAQIEGILETLEDAIFRKNLDNTIVLWSRGAERVYGYTRQEMLGTSVTRLLPPDRQHEATEIIGRIANGDAIEGLETKRVHKEGHVVDVVLSVSPVRDQNGKIIGALVVARDITRQKAAETAVKQLEAFAEKRALILETANRVALEILSSQGGIQALAYITEAAKKLSGARYAALGVARLDGTGVSEFVTVGLTPEEEAAIGPRPQGKGLLGILLEQTTALRLDDIHSHARSVGFPPNHPPMRSFLGVPIRRGDSVLGSLYLTDKENGASFTVEDEIAVEALGAHAAIAIYNLQMLSRQRALIRGLIAAQEDERRAIAYDLHDGLTQYVMASHAHLESFRRAQAKGDEVRSKREMDKGLSFLKEAVVESRRLVNGLRALVLDDLGLAGALEQLLNEEKLRSNWVDAQIVHNVAGRRFDKTVETAVYRIAQEALTNARKHAAADRIRLMMLLAGESATGIGQLTLEIRDWGKGFDPAERARDQVHVGLHSMGERAQLLGGTYTLDSAPGQGTIVRAVLPALPYEEEQDE